MALEIKFNLSRRHRLMSRSIISNELAASVNNKSSFKADVIFGDSFSSESPASGTLRHTSIRRVPEKVDSAWKVIGLLQEFAREGYSYRMAY